MKLLLFAAWPFFNDFRNMVIANIIVLVFQNPKKRLFVVILKNISSWNSLMIFQAPTKVSKLTCRAWQVVHDLYLPDIMFGLPEISYTIYARIAYIIYHGSNDLKTNLLLNFVALFPYFRECAIFCILICSVQKFSLPIQESAN